MHRICTGAKETISVKVNGKKTPLSKRLMLLTLREAHELFKKDNPEIKVGLSKFCELRPKWCILPTSAGIHNVCVCQAHQNVKLMSAATKVTNDYKK